MDPRELQGLKGHDECPHCGMGLFKCHDYIMNELCNGNPAQVCCHNCKEYYTRAPLHQSWVPESRRESFNPNL